MPPPPGTWDGVFDPALGSPFSQGWDGTLGGTPFFDLSEGATVWLGTPLARIRADVTRSPFIAAIKFTGVPPFLAAYGSLRHRYNASQSIFIQFGSGGQITSVGPGADPVLGIFGVGSTIVISSRFYYDGTDLQHEIQLGSSYGSLAPVYDGPVRFGTSLLPNGALVEGGYDETPFGDPGGPEDTFIQILWAVYGNQPFVPDNPPPPTGGPGSWVTGRVRWNRTTGGGGGGGEG